MLITVLCICSSWTPLDHLVSCEHHLDTMWTTIALEALAKIVSWPHVNPKDNTWYFMLWMLWNIDDQCRGPSIEKKDHLAGKVNRAQSSNRSVGLFFSFKSLDSPDVPINAPVCKVMVGLVQESNNFLPVFAEMYLFMQVSEFCQVCHCYHFWHTFWSLFILLPHLSPPQPNSPIQ